MDRSFLLPKKRDFREKHDSGFPDNAIKYCLKSQGINFSDIQKVINYEKLLLTFVRLLETYVGSAPRGGRYFGRAMTAWAKQKLFIKKQIITKPEI